MIIRYRPGVHQLRSHLDSAEDNDYLSRCVSAEDDADGAFATSMDARSYAGGERAACWSRAQRGPNLTVTFVSDPHAPHPDDDY